MIARLLLFAMTLPLVGCDNIAALMADPKVAQRIADSKAIGSACRYGMRSIEDCYALNEKASRRLSSTAGKRWTSTCATTRSMAYRPKL